MAVMFDAVGTTSTLVDDTFRQVTYTFDYDDANATGNWTHSGRPKNSDVGGPLGAHVFELPGTYTVQVSAQVGSTTSTDTVVITVADPDVTYAGALTVCISTDASTGWGPAGATYQTTLPSGTGWNGKRWMFKRGQDFTASFGNLVSLSAAATGFVICAGGSGAKPILPSFKSSSSRPSTLHGDSTAVCGDNVTITDVVIRGYRANNATGVLMHKVDLVATNQTEGIDFSGDYWPLTDPSKNYATTAYRIGAKRTFSECTFSADYSATTTNVLTYVEGKYTAFIGCEWQGGAVEHNLRTPWTWKGFVAHNRVQGGYKTSGRHCITARSAGLLDIGPYDTYQDYMVPLGNTKSAQRFMVIAWNDLSGDNDYPRDGGLPAVTFEISSQNHTNAEGSEDVLVEGNVLRARPTGYDGSGAQEIWLCGRRVTYLNNVEFGGTTAVGIVQDWKGGGVPAEWKGPYYTSRA